MRRIFVLLAVASLSGCITDGPNKTGSSWLDANDLGPQGLHTVRVPVGFVAVDTIVEPGVPSYSGIGSLVVGGTDAFDAVTSLWFDATDTTRWGLGGPAGKVDSAGWTLRVVLDTTCSGAGKVGLRRWNSVPDVGTFLMGGSIEAAPAQTIASGACRDTGSIHNLDFHLGDSSLVVRKKTRFGVRLEGDGFAARKVLSVHLLDKRGDTLRLATHDGRGAWGTRFLPKWRGSIAGMSATGTRLRMRFKGDALRLQLRRALGVESVASDSFDNTFVIHSARADAPVVSVSNGVAQRFRLASWIVEGRDTTSLAFGKGSNASQSFVTRRDRDARKMEGDLRVRGYEGGLARVSLVVGSDSVPFYTTEGVVVNHFYLFPGDSIEAPMYQDPGWTKFTFRNDGQKIHFVRTILHDGVSADDQVLELDDYSKAVYREEAIARPGVSKVRLEARSAFGKILNNKAQEVWTDLYTVSVTGESILEGVYRIDLAASPLDSVTFTVRRRSQGVVE